MLHDEDQIRDSPLPFTPSSYPSRKRSSRSCSPPSLLSSLPSTFVQNSSQHHTNEPPTIYSLDKAPIPHHPSTTASSRLTTEQLALPHGYAVYFSNHLNGHDPSASYETSASHSTSSIEDWIDKTSLDTSSSTLAKILERVPPFTQPSSPTTPSLGKRKRSLSPANQESQGAELLPLTKRLLRLHTKSMANNSVHKTPTKDDAQRKAAGPPTSSSGSSGSNIDPKWVRMRMECHHIYRQSDAFHHADYSEFKERILSPIAQERASGVKPGGNSRFKEIHEICARNGATEAAFKREMLEHIIMKDFQFLADPGDPSQGIQPVFESRDSLGGGIFCQAEQPLRRGFLPHNYPTGSLSPNDIADRLKVDGMLNSKPDSTWGYLGRVLDPISEGAMIQDYTNSLLTICPGLYCPFFILEVKTDNGSMEVCRNQAARGCATIVNAMRQLLRMLRREDTYIYCTTMSEEMMEWWVGWAEVCEGGRVDWHINRLRREDFEEENPLLVMRRFTHNILEWGLTTRLPIIRKLVSDLYVKDRMLLAGEEKMGPSKSPSTGKSVINASKVMFFVSPSIPSRS